MTWPADWLTDDAVERLRGTSPHPTIPTADLATFRRALDDLQPKVRCNLRCAERLRHTGQSFELLYRLWQARNQTLLGLRVQLNDAVIRHQPVDLAQMWDTLISVRNTLHEHIRIKVVA